MKSSTLVGAALLAGCGAALAQGVEPKMAPSTDGEVRKVDVAQGKLTLRHGRIENLDMGAMTMVFRVADSRMLDRLKQGDRVKFAADNVNGALTVLAIELVK
jgi:Cu(I)/Ag(I) efflux system protein CusF